MIKNHKITEAFAEVPRERYLGHGPWTIHSRLSVGTTYKSVSDDPKHLYHDLLISIDEALGINNGLPSLWAHVFDNLDIKPGETVLQVGAGLGYFTAILAELVTETGRVVAYEYEDKLAKQAKQNLNHYQQVEVISGNAAEADEFPQLDIIVGCAGVTHVPKVWLSHLAECGRLVLPFTGEDQWGFLLHLQKSGADLSAKSIGPCGFYHCYGARTEEDGKALMSVLKSEPRSVQGIQHYHVGAPREDQNDVWLKGNGFWITKSKVS
ncbi:rRNA adenine N-6-methyltransferase family protein [Pseudovibrio sp. POLY-S9]|uniref:protein-L-isoaspartate O-methyltransferase family protein n=1 Tax=Pseudovibrio sp. POLY-S9 TaxID=1576596 RepID=UPI001AD8A601|nr:rRNA adenine N-6-methyltransferase family protein [Pseudovibrio sp. POLY-S9]